MSMDIFKSPAYTVNLESLHDFYFANFFYFRIISEFLNSRASVHVFYNIYRDSLLARTLNSRGKNLRISVKIKFSRIFPDLQYHLYKERHQCLCRCIHYGHDSVVIHEITQRQMPSCPNSIKEVSFYPSLLDPNGRQNTKGHSS